MRKHRRRLRTEASRIQSGMMLDFEDDLPRMVDEVKHHERKVLCTVDGIQHSFESDEIVYLASIIIK